MARGRGRPFLRDGGTVVDWWRNGTRCTTSLVELDGVIHETWIGGIRHLLRSSGASQLFGNGPSHGEVREKLLDYICSCALICRQRGL